MAPPRRTLSTGPPSIVSGGEDDQRFAELLRPIKDLTENWQVPLARYLEEYYDELHDIQISLDGQTTKVNFTEAAMFLQGTASVYSKKVEYLWQSVLSMIALLASKKALDEVEGADGPGSNGKRSKKSALADPNSFSLVDIEMCSNMDLKSDNFSSQSDSGAGGFKASTAKENHARKMSLKFIFVTPRQLIEKEGREQKSSRVNIYLKSGTTHEMLGHKEDFRINSQFAMATAMIGEDLEADTDLGQMSVSLFDESVDLNSTASSLTSQIHQVDPGGGEGDARGDVADDNNFEFDLSAGDHGDFFGNDGNDVDMMNAMLDSFHTVDVATAKADAGANAYANNNNNVNDNEVDISMMNGGESTQGMRDTNVEDEILTRTEVGRRRKDKLAELVDEPRAPLADPWEPVKPQEAAMPVKKRRKGRTSKAPAPNIELRRTGTRSRRKDPEEVSDVPPVTVNSFVANVMAIGRHSEVRQGDNIPPEIEKEANKLLKALKKTKDGNPAVELNENNENDQLDDDGWTEANFDNDNFDNNDFDEEEAMPSTAHSNFVDKNATEESEDVDTYEDLVMKRVAEYVAQSQEYIESTDLAKRVRKWHESIAPKLDEVERRGDFDVHDYGTKILSHFDSNDDTGEKCRKTTYYFKDLCVGKEKEEVARLFLSTLMLANTYNIELKAELTDSDVLPMDKIEMTLLSTTRHHQQLMDYQAPSQESPTPSSSSQAAASSNRDVRGTKNGHKTSKNKKSGKNVLNLNNQENVVLNHHVPLVVPSSHGLDRIDESDDEYIGEEVDGLVNGHDVHQPISPIFKVPSAFPSTSNKSKSCKRKK